MKYSLIAISGLAALAAAADSTTDAAPAPAVTSLSPEARCAAKCAASDVCCLAQCFKVPCPSESMANDNTKCAAACPQGSGSPSDTEAYAKCQQACFSSHFFPATGNQPVETGSSGNTDSATGTVAGSSATATSGSDSSSSASGSSKAESSASRTSSGSGAATSTGAASQLGASAAGIFGLILAAFAL
ncbi:hypothetical protein VTN00DRAFT_7937 [Thermoascus crustaceus]|uniref:uncharacterized protein n=1 Tax=Thermoascus crustaceus TaxID=5088 RepID=UPI00374292DA